MITVNMNQAKQIKRNIIRKDRKPLLEKLDVDFMRAVESGDTALQAEISAKKQALRDAPADPTIDAATTPEELKAIVPAAITNAQ